MAKRLSHRCRECCVCVSSRSPLDRSCTMPCRPSGPRPRASTRAMSLNDTRPSPTGAPGRAYTNRPCPYPLAERDSLLRQRCCAAAFAKRLSRTQDNHRCGLLKVRFPPHSDRIADIQTGRLCAKRRHRPGYSMTSLAAASRLGGTVRPSAFAVLRLITKS